MSFLAGRLAATEGAYFLHESKNVVSRHAQKLPPTPLPSLPVAAEARSKIADVLPEILRHDVPLKGISTADASSLSASSKWLVRGSSSSSSSMVSPDSLNPLRAYVSLPQATFGPKRWQLSNEHPNISASTANDLRRDRFPRPADPEKIKAALAAYAQIGKAFAAATSIVFGGATFLFVYVAYKLELHTTDDIRIKVRELIQPGAETLMEQMGPFRAWVANTSRKWHHESDGGAKEKTIVKELSKTFRARTPN
ncbi:uncharacterized protein LOC121969923 [Zingiber officinale]|uniref:uncharacterized protein LOC121969923 n=1 Tax=Zingiber officinale TaxID=94328 RepID=UPI001C4A7EA9|nr:uncharacterized protein LOC121969923 [Zingiber officinale]